VVFFSLGSVIRDLSLNGKAVRASLASVILD